MEPTLLLDTTASSSLSFSTPAAPLTSLALPAMDQQHHQQERLLRGAHNLQLNQMPTPESRALYAACSEGAGIAKVCWIRIAEVVFCHIYAETPK